MTRDNQERAPVDCVLWTNLWSCKTPSDSPICAHWVHGNRPDAHSVRFSISGTRLCLGVGPHPPTPHASLAHGRTPNQHCSHDCSSSSSISTRTWRPNQPFSLLPSSCPLLVSSDTHSRTHRCSCLIVRTKIAATTPLKAIAGIATYPLAQLDIASLPGAFVSRLFKFFFALDASCS